MASPNISELATTTLNKRSKKIRDNVTKNNALLMRLEKKNKIRLFDGGVSIYEELSYAENGNAQWYSGFDTLSVAAQDTLTSAEFAIKQLAVPVVFSGLEELQNSGESRMIGLLSSRMQVAESTMANKVAEGLYSDGTGSSSKIITGLDAAVPQDPTTGTYGGINRATASNTFWRSQLLDPASTPTATTIQGFMNVLYLSCSRGADMPDLIIGGATIFPVFEASMQALQRFTSAEVGDLGFPSIKYKGADVVADGGVGGFANTNDMYFLNTNYIHYRPHQDRNMVAIGKKRQSANQDATVEILGWAGNLTMSGSRFQGRGKFD